MDNRLPLSPFGAEDWTCPTYVWELSWCMMLHDISPHWSVFSSVPVTCVAQFRRYTWKYLQSTPLYTWNKTFTASTYSHFYTYHTITKALLTIDKRDDCDYLFRIYLLLLQHILWKEREIFLPSSWLILSMNRPQSHKYKITVETTFYKILSVAVGSIP